MVVTKAKCACTKCSCEVEESSAVSLNGQLFCSKPCSTGHVNNEPCHGSGSCGCTCGD
ncbi:MAG: conjugal transfer protein TrbI [Synechococcus sp. ARS1019]|nr:conjugal transfer protein TrbI [Synechococcus sp. ARS1019]